MFGSEHVGQGGDQQNGEDYLISIRVICSSLIVEGVLWDYSQEQCLICGVMLELLVDYRGEC